MSATDEPEGPTGLTTEESERLMSIARREPAEKTAVGAVVETLAARAAVVGTFTPRGLTEGLGHSKEMAEALH
jgi:hypothetical protein